MSQKFIKSKNNNLRDPQLFAVLPLPVVIPLIDWYDKSLSGSFKKFQ